MGGGSGAWEGENYKGLPAHRGKSRATNKHENILKKKFEWEKGWGGGRQKEKKSKKKKKRKQNYATGGFVNTGRPRPHL